MKKFISDIKGFENCDDFIIYDDGRIFSLNKKDFMQLSEDSNGYLYIDLRRYNSIVKCPKVHRLVMLAFNEDEPKEQINHIDGNKHNNHIKNLEWCTNRENRIHAIETGLKNEVNYKIAQYDLEHNLLNIFDTCKEAMAYLGKNTKNPGQIGRVINGKRKTAYGYIWKQYNGSTTIAGVQVHSSEWKQGESEKIKI